jgi:hypothetical protein
MQKRWTSRNLSIKVLDNQAIAEGKRRHWQRRREEQAAANVLWKATHGNTNRSKPSVNQMINKPAHKKVARSKKEEKPAPKKKVGTQEKKT